MLVDSIIKIVAESMGISESDLNEESLMEDIEAWDSLTHMELIADLETIYNIEFVADDIVEMTSIKKIVQMIEAKINGNK